MGEIKKQGITNSVVLYIGLVLGYLNVVILFPNFFDKDIFGLTRTLLAFGNLLAIISQFGASNVTIKYLHYFKTEDRNNYGFLLLVLGVPLFGAFFFSLLFTIFQNSLIEAFSKSGQLFKNNFFWIIPLVFGIVLFDALSSYSRAIFRSIFPNILKEILIRVLISIVILITGLTIMPKEWFIPLFIGSYILPFIILFVYLALKKEINFTTKPSILNSALSKEMANYGLVTMFHRLTGMLNKRVDILMLTALANLEKVAIYTVAFYIGNAIMIPSKGLLRIASPKVAQAFASQRWNDIRSIYQKTQANQFLVGSFLFLIIYINRTEIIKIINPDYLEGTAIITFIGIGKLIAMSTGVTNQVILHSNFYKYNLAFIVLILAFTVSLNFLLIPIYGTEGAAISTMLTIVIMNAIKVGFIWYKMQLQPFNLNTLKILVIIAFGLIASWLLPDFTIAYRIHTIANLAAIAIKTIFLALIYLGGFLLLRPSEDIETLLVNLRDKIKLKNK